MQFSSDDLTSLVGQVHGLSMVLGICLGIVVVGVTMLVVFNRMQRSHLLLSLRMEQAVKNNRRLEDESAQLHREHKDLEEKNQRLERENVGLKASLR